MNERIEAWLRLATERLADSEVPLYLMPGNDDDFGIDPILDRRRVLARQRGREGARHARRAAAARVRLVEHHAVADAARGDGGRAVRAGSTRSREQVRDPRRAVFMIHVPAARLRARHGADPRREPAPDRLGRRRPARPGRLDGGAAGDRDLPAAARGARPHPRVGRRAQDRRDALHQPGQRGEPRHPPRLPRRHRRATGIELVQRVEG